MAASMRDWIVLGLILALATGLRLLTLNDPLWFDEIVTVETHLKLGWGEMLQSYSMNHHYLHNLLAKLTMTLFGDSPWAIRLPALVFGIGSIAAMWVLARQVAGTFVAHVTALLLALSYHHIWFSTNARGYTGLALFSILGLICFLRGLDVPTRRIWLAFGATLAATVFTHLTGAFFFATLGLVWLGVVAGRWMRGRLPRGVLVEPFIGFLVGGLLAAVLYLPVLPSLMEAVGGVAATSAVDPMREYQNPIWTATEAIRTGLGDAGMLVSVVGGAVLALSLLGAISLARRAPLVGVVTFGHMALMVVILSGVGMRIWPRFFFTDIGLLLLLILLGVRLVCMGLVRVLPQRLGSLAFPVAVGAMLILSAGLATRNFTAPKQDLAGAVAFVDRIGQPDTRVYATLHSGELFTGHFKRDWGTLWTDADYAAALAEPGPVLIVVTFPDRTARTLIQLDADHDAGRLSELNFLHGTLGDGDILILRRN